MTKLDKYIEQDIAEWENFERRKEIRKAVTKEDSTGSGIRQFVILADILTDCIPWFEQFQPQSTEVENQIVFAPVRAFFTRLSADKELLDRLTGESMEGS